MSEITTVYLPMQPICNPAVLLILFLHGQMQFSRVRPSRNRPPKALDEDETEFLDSYEAAAIAVQSNTVHGLKEKSPLLAVQVDQQFQYFTLKKPAYIVHEVATHKQVLLNQLNQFRW
ncbi:unnamed protein product [Trifolium pratense]|uniref:Uncharacterized protein n=2 Tax=Trifolium pratense TaxID=57577 RepID=A0ACB0ILW5_TRIPR|nr:unnamed protein product [Trifolium pratense]